jgi:CheY-like chemotaxis protein
MALPADQVILLVDDSPEDRVATLRAINKAGLPNPVIWVENGDQALDFLYQRGDYSDPTTSPRPGVILLDLNMPGTDGREVLDTVMKDPKLKPIPIVVLTTSSDERDIDAFFQSGAKSYIVKPASVEGIVKAVQQLQSLWSFRF